MNKNGDVAKPKAKISNDTSNLKNENDFDRYPETKNRCNLIRSQDLGPDGIKFRIKKIAYFVSIIFLR